MQLSVLTLTAKTDELIVNSVFLFPASDHTSAYMNPSLAYALTFSCPGFTFREYAAVYWLGPLTGSPRSHAANSGHFLNLVMSPIWKCQNAETNVLFFSTGMSLAVLLYMGHIPRAFSRNLFYAQKTRFRVPKSSGEQEETKKK